MEGEGREGGRVRERRGWEKEEKRMKRGREEGGREAGEGSGYNLYAAG